MFRPLPPKLRIFDVDLYRSFEAQKFVFGIRTSPSDISGPTVMLRSYCTRILLCAKKTKITLFNNLFSSMSVFDVRSQEYHNACVQCCWMPAPASGTLHTCVVMNAHRRLTRKRRNCWIKLFLFSLCTKKYSHSFITMRLNHWCHMDYFNNVLTTFLGLERGSCIVVYAGSESSRISSKIS